jgi:hypothetical protein
VNRNSIILAWVVVESKNKESWRYFFRHLVEAILELIEEETVFISDRDKGLRATDNELGENILRAVCT